MADVLLVSKPIAPPWHDSSKNLVRDLAGHMQRYRPIVLSQPNAQLDMPRAKVERIYAANGGGFSPALRDNARVLARLWTGRRDELWHFFFAPNPKTSSIAALSSRLRRIRTLQTVCSAPHERVDIAKWLFADRIVVLSEHTRSRCLAAGVARDRVRLIRPSVPTLTPLARERVATERARLDLPIDRPLVVYAGDMEFGRGADLALEAQADLPRELNALLIMACRAKTPRARERERSLRERASALDIANQVRFLGETPLIHALLSVADLVTLPTDTLYAKMDLPLVLVEAMALGRTVLVGKGTPAEELAIDDGAVAVATEREAVSAATRRLLEDASARERIGERARRNVARDYDPTQMAAQYELLYDELCA
ncbi:MAG TPA: glycosyltransferase family 4 protein [Polyangiales bacterium]